jgi:zinc protease
MISIFRFFIPHSAFPACPAGRRIPKLKYLIILVFLMLCVGLPNGGLRAMPPVQRTVLANQLVLLICEEHSLPFVTFQLLIDSGARRDPYGKEGLAHLAARGLLLGTSKRKVTAMNEELDFMGASLNSSSGRDYATLSLRVLKKDLDKGSDLFMEVLTQPTFPEEEIRREVEKIMGAIQAEEDEPGDVAQKEFEKNLFLTSPYGHPIKGTKQSVPRLTRDAVLRLYRTYYHPNNAILTIVGDITGEEVKTRLVPHLEKWPMAEIPKESFYTAFAKEPKTVKTNRTITQANIILGHAGVSRGNPDYYSLSVMNYILGGGGFASRLVERIRNKRGLAYSVASFFDPGKYPGSFQIILQTKNASAREAISLALQQLDLIQKEPVSERELEGAKKYLIGSFPLRLDTQGKLANFLSQVEYFGLGLDYPEKYPSFIRSVTKEEVLRVAKAYLHPKSCIVVVVANLKEAGMD